MRIDLHAHSAVSDGTESPADLVASARAANLDVVALTDHDTVAGWHEAWLAAARLGTLTLLPGTEISCRHEGIGLHLLAYCFDPDHPQLALELRRIRNDRVPRARAMVRRMTEAGLPLTWEDVLARLAPGCVVGRPHIADAMIAAGMVGSREEAFGQYLHRRSPYYVPHRAIDPVVAVELVVAAGGVAVLAHPGAARRGTVVDDSLIGRMAKSGLAGLEVDHPDHDEETRTRLRGLAADLGLLVTGSSDYHGAGKPARLGQETTDPGVYEALLARTSGTVRA